MANATRDLYWTHDWSNCVWACCLEPCHILVKKNDLKRHDYKQQIYYINMINLDPLQRLVASILQVCLCKRKTLLLVTMPCTSIGSNTLSVRPHYRQQKVNVEEENMSTCLSLSPPPPSHSSLFSLGFASLKGQLGSRIVKSLRNSLGRQRKSWQHRRPESLLPTQSGLSRSTQKWEKTMATHQNPALTGFIHFDQWVGEMEWSDCTSRSGDTVLIGICRLT